MRNGARSCWAVEPHFTFFTQGSHALLLAIFARLAILLLALILAKDLALISLAQVVPTAALPLERRCVHADRCGRRQVTITSAEARALVAEVRGRRCREEKHREIVASVQL